MKALIVLWTNGMVACFDEQGEQMPEYQGHYGEVIDKIMDRWPHRTIALAQWRGAADHEILAYFHPVRVR